MSTILADDIGELGTVKLAPRSLQLSLLPHPASSSAAAAAAAAAPAPTDKVGKTDARTQFKFSRSFAVPSTYRFSILPTSGQVDEKLIRNELNATSCTTNELKSARRAAFRAACVLASPLHRCPFRVPVWVLRLPGAFPRKAQRDWPLDRVRVLGEW